MGSEVRWRCEPAESASVCQEAGRAHVAPGGTHLSPAGRQVVLLAPPPPEPPAGLGGRLGGENKHFQNQNTSWIPLREIV